MERTLQLIKKTLTHLKHEVTPNLLTQLGCCTLCQQKCQQQPLICDFCKQDLPRFYYQKVNGNLLNWPAIDKLFNKRYFDRLVCLAPYQWPFDQWLTQFKYQQHIEFSRLLADLIRELLESLPLLSTHTGLIPVPIHPKKWQVRGFNQSHLITKNFIQHFQCLFMPDAIYRLNNHASQVGLTGKERRKSLTNAFELDSDRQWPQKVVIFDDVITTGATVNAISRLLKQKGVKHITVLTVAISLPD